MKRGLRIGIFSLLVVLLATMGPAGKVFAHCEIPCGIYDDKARIAMISEDLTTIEKSMKKIVELGKQDSPNMNQIVRWVQNKETHANRIAQVVTQYFMTQRLKPGAEEGSQEHKAYISKLQLLHSLLFYSMKAKQSTDLAHVEMMRMVLAKFADIYFKA